MQQIVRGPGYRQKQTRKGTPHIPKRTCRQFESGRNGIVADSALKSPLTANPPVSNPSSPPMLLEKLQ